jgi:hypothetical protein
VKGFSIEEYQKSQLDEERLDVLYQENLFKLFVPKAYGGLELNLKSGIQELIRFASIQGGMGWVLNLGAGANWFSGFFSDHAARDVFTAKDAVIAGSGFVTGTFTEKSGQFYIDGTWSRCSGASHATFFSLKAKNEKGLVKTFVVPRKDVVIKSNDWPITGLRNASSHAISLRHVSIPKHYAFEINTRINPNAYAVHHVPFDIFARFCMAASFIGIVKCLVHQSRLLPLNPVALQFIADRLDPISNAAESICLGWANAVDHQLNAGALDQNELMQLKVDLADKNKALFGAVQELFLKGGLPFVEEDNLVHWAYRDVLTAVQHHMVKGESTR